MNAARTDALLPRHHTEIDLLAWLGQAKAGDVLEYHQGFLALDRSTRKDSVKERERAALGRVADQAMRLAEHGLVHLLQRRVRDERFSYLAIARPRAVSSPLSISTLIPEENT
jgi:hypothetical protein